MPPGSLKTLAAAAALALLVCTLRASTAAVGDVTDNTQTTDGPNDAASPSPTPASEAGSPAAAESDQTATPGTAPAEAPAPPSGAPPAAAASGEQPEAQVAQGHMRGAVLATRRGRPIYAFRGIPFAKPPLGALRFQAPEPAGPWEGTLDASKDAAYCVQKNYLIPPYPVSGSEDCLFLNVFSPKMRSSGLPVIVYIHGGGFFAGSGASFFNGPQYLLDHDVVLVTMNYRLGALGFLSSGDERAPGNAGLKDQSLALLWVKVNVHAFGGDPNLVTIMGQSAGGASVHYHMLSPLSKGLFQRAISQSGTALSTWALPVDATHIALRQAQLLGCDAPDMGHAIDCLRQADAVNLTESGHGFHFWDIDPLTVFRPVVEAPNRGAFLIDDPAVLMQMGDFAHVPWLTGSVQQEGLIRALPILGNATLSADLNARWDEIMPRLMELELSAAPEDIPALWRNISHFYVGDASPHVDISDPQPFIDLYSDRGFLQGFRRAVDLHARAGHKRIFLYELEFRGQFSYSMLFGGGITNYGVSHCDDLLSLFYAPAIFPDMPGAGSIDATAVDTLTQLWTDFAKYGDPTPRPDNKKTKKPSSSSSSSSSSPTTPRPATKKRESASTAASNHEDLQCWSDVADVHWDAYTPAARADDCELTFLHIGGQPPAQQQQQRQQDGPAQSAEAEKLRFCMRKGFHKRRLDFWRSLPINENKVLSIERLLLPFFYLVGVIF